MSHIIQTVRFNANLEGKLLSFFVGPNHGMDTLLEIVFAPTQIGTY